MKVKKDIKRKVFLRTESQEGLHHQKIFTSRSHDRETHNDGGALSAGSHLPTTDPKMLAGPKFFSKVAQKDLVVQPLMMKSDHPGAEKQRWEIRGPLFPVITTPNKFICLPPLPWVKVTSKIKKKQSKKEQKDNTHCEIIIID